MTVLAVTVLLFDEKNRALVDSDKRGVYTQYGNRFQSNHQQLGAFWYERSRKVYDRNVSWLVTHERNIAY